MPKLVISQVVLFYGLADFKVQPGKWGTKVVWE